jgi:hypothetical protein
MYTELCIIITFILLIIAAAAELPRSSHAISINYSKLNSSYEQYKIVKQVVDNNAFSNLSRNLSPPVTSNSKGLTNLAPGNNGGSNTTSASSSSSPVTSNSKGLTNLAPGNNGGSNTTSASGGSFSSHNRAAVKHQQHHTPDGSIHLRNEL